MDVPIVFCCCLRDKWTIFIHFKKNRLPIFYAKMTKRQKIVVLLGKNDCKTAVRAFNTDSRFADFELKYW
jgi:hypothetical protein